MTVARNSFLVSSVIRGTDLSESHGGLYLVNFQDSSSEICLDWASPGIDVDGRGGDRGLRGIAVDDDGIWVASSCALLRFDSSFTLLNSFTNRYLKHCHEISLAGGNIYIVSTGFDALLQFNCVAESFDVGYHLYRRDGGIGIAAFDPQIADGPARVNEFHLNSVTSLDTNLYFAGLRTPALFRISGSKLSIMASLPFGTHNAQPFGNGVIFNDTVADRVSARGGDSVIDIDVPFDLQVLAPIKHTDPRLARPFFARGLLPIDENWVVGGVSPSTLCLYDLQTGKVEQRVQLSTDVRNAIHGIAAWPGNRRPNSIRPI